MLTQSWSYATRVSTTAWDSYADVQNGLFGKIMSVSVVAHDVYSDMSDLTGQFDSLSRSYFNVSTINLSTKYHH